MRNKILTLLMCMSLGASAPLAAQSDEAERVAKATQVFEEIMAVPEKAIPEKILANADAIAVFPSTLKGGFGIGAHHGKGIISRRNRETGTWTAPGFLSLTGGSFGAQIGGQALDLVLVVMNKNGLDSLMKSEFKIGADASVAAGPIGRNAEASTDLMLKAEILSYSRTRGLFAGVSLNGSVVNEDEDANRDFYGRPVRNAQILDESPRPVGTSGNQPLPDVVTKWRNALGQFAK
jgi:lipid-binding SYLF domain-containing protein